MKSTIAKPNKDKVNELLNELVDMCKWFQFFRRVTQSREIATKRYLEWLLNHDTAKFVTLTMPEMEKDELYNEFFSEELQKRVEDMKKQLERKKKKQSK